MVSPNPKLYDVAKESLTLEETERIKHANCVQYERCLDYACKVDWNQFHCGECEAYKAIVVDVTAIECSDPSHSLVTIGRAFGGGGRSSR
jgi:hypothetical protein